MRKGQNRKVKIESFGGDFWRRAGKVSCFGLFGLGVMLANPMFAFVANALTAEDLESGSLTSSVSISFAPASGNTTLSPTDASGASGLISVLANVGVSNSGGYSVYLGSSSPNLVGRKDSSVIIPGVSGEVSFSDLQDNTWGYYAGEGSFIPEDATYKAVSQGQGDVIFVNNNSTVKNENKIFMLGFAAKISNDVPADTYENQVTLSVLSSPYQLTLMDIDNMQDMTSAICENTPQLSTKQLKDVRDGKYYWVTKLADNNCWMTQNLDLDLGSEWPDASLSDYVVASTEYNPVPTAKEATAETFDASNMSTRSWNLGEFVMLMPNLGGDCGSGHNTLESCSDQVASILDKSASSDPDFFLKNGATTTSTEYDAHYMVGNYYTWNTATAGTGGVITSGEASGSICPRGWRLPTSIIVNDFNNLMSEGGANTIEALTSPPYFLMRSGYVNIFPNLLASVGVYGSYWYSNTYNGDTSYPDAVRMMFLRDSSETVAPFGYSYQRYYGRSVRCLARS